jgi:hypothetical protein
VHEVGGREHAALGGHEGGAPSWARAARTAAWLVTVHCSTSDAGFPYAAAAFVAYLACASASGPPGCLGDQYETASVSAGPVSFVVKAMSARCASHMRWKSRSCTDQSAVRVGRPNAVPSMPVTAVVVAW